MKTPRERLWDEYQAALKAGRRAEAARLLRVIQRPRPTSSPGGCGSCRKRF